MTTLFLLYRLKHSHDYSVSPLQIKVVENDYLGFIHDATKLVHVLYYKQFCSCLVACVLLCKSLKEAVADPTWVQL